MNYPIDRLTAENQLKGYALWVLLTASIDFIRGGITDQGTSQVIEIEWDTERDNDLPLDWFEYKIEIVIDSENEAVDHEVILQKSTVEKSYELLTQQNYVLSVKQFLCALPWIKKGKFSEISGMLKYIDCDEYNLSDMKQLASLDED